MGIDPYYDRDGITVYHARVEELLSAGLVPVGDIALIHADPPYGVSEQTARKQKARGVVSRGSSSKLPASTRTYDFPPVEGDDQPYDPAPLLALDRPTVLWGANHYAPRVPPSPSWIIWDKREEFGSDDNADCEMAWSNLGGPARIFRHLWRGALRRTEKLDKHLHPTQKPIALSAWVFDKAKLEPGDLVLVPYLGSGPDLPAAQARGLRVIACDVAEWCCRVAVARLGAAPQPVPVEELGPLFGGDR